jgi:para-nitrobenzyl esterase
MLEALRVGRYDDRFGDVTIPFYPVSGTDHQPVSAMEAAEAGATSHVDLVIGTNPHEMSLFKVMEEAGRSAAVRPRQWLAQPWEAQVRHVYAATEPEASAERIDWTVAGDRGFRIPNLRAAEGRVRSGSRTWMYEFAWESPAFGGRLGAAHGLECPFVFDDFGSGLGQFLVGPDGPHDLAETMHETWISFARSGRPASARLPEWPEFDLQDRRVAVFDADPRIESDRDRERREAWDGLPIGHTFPRREIVSAIAVARRPLLAPRRDRLGVVLGEAHQNVGPLLEGDGRVEARGVDVGVHDIFRHGHSER